MRSLTRLMPAKPVWIVASLASVATLFIPIHALAVDETFTYNDGALEGQGAVGDWTSPWYAGSQSQPPSDSTPWQVQSQAVTINPKNPVAAFGFENSDLGRDLTTPLSGSSVYMSYLITPGDMGAVFDPNLFTDGSTGVVVGFGDTTSNVDNNGPMITTFRFHEGFTGLVTDGFAISLGGVFSSSNTNIGTWAQGQTYRMVGRLTFNDQGQKERWSVWIDPLAESDPAAGSVTNDLGYSDISKARMYEFVSNFAGAGSSMIDDLRIGDTWESVTSTITPPLLGDLDNDGFVGINDLNIVLGNWNQNVPPANPLADPSGDGFVGIDDLNAVLGNWNAGTPPNSTTNIPEPTTLGTLGILGMLTMHTRRTKRPSSPHTR